MKIMTDIAAAVGGRNVSRQPAWRRRVGLVLTLLCGLGAAPFTAAATRTVTTLADETDGSDSALSLREAIAASAAGDTINFSVIGIITLTGGELWVPLNLTI